jgi:hypothetical protein
MIRDEEEGKGLKDGLENLPKDAIIMIVRAFVYWTTRMCAIVKI